MLAVVALLFYALGIAFAIEAIMTARTPQGASAWALALVSFPFIAVPAYLVFGRNKFQGYVEAYEERAEDIDRIFLRVARNLEPFSSPPTQLADVRQAMQRISGFDLVIGNRAELLIDGQATFDSLLAGLAEAQDSICFQFYILRDDGIGRRIRDVLIERARAGVTVLVLFDDIGSFRLPRAYLRALTQAGVQAKPFRPTQGRRNRLQLNFRNHRKIVVVDGRVGWVGGLNVGDEYLGLDPAMSPWRDTHLRLEGPMVTQLQAVFFADWYWAARHLPELNWQPEAVEDGIPGMVLPFSPSQRLETASLFFVATLQVARERIWISAPYFVPDSAVMKALKLAALRGVDVRIITTGKSDSLPVFLAAFAYMEILAEAGVRFFAFRPGFLHEKTLVIDNSIASVGTANFDNRSFRLNFEVNAALVDEEFAEAMDRMFRDTLASCEELHPETFKERPWYWRFGVKACRLLAPIL